MRVTGIPVHRATTSATVVRVHLLLEELELLLELSQPRLPGVDALLKLRDLAVLDLGRAPQIAGPGGAVHLHLQLVEAAP